MPWTAPTARVNINKDYTAAEAAALLGVTVETAKAYCRTAKLKPARRVGPRKEWRVPGQAIKRLRDQWAQIDGNPA